MIKLDGLIDLSAQYIVAHSMLGTSVNKVYTDVLGAIESKSGSYISINDYIGGMYTRLYENRDTMKTDIDFSRISYKDLEEDDDEESSTQKVKGVDDIRKLSREEIIKAASNWFKATVGQTNAVYNELDIQNSVASAIVSDIEDEDGKKLSLLDFMEREDEADFRILEEDDTIKNLLDIMSNINSYFVLFPYTDMFKVTLNIVNATKDLSSMTEFSTVLNTYLGVRENYPVEMPLCFVDVDLPSTPADSRFYNIVRYNRRINNIHILKELKSNLLRFKSFLLRNDLEFTEKDRDIFISGKRIVEDVRYFDFNCIKTKYDYSGLDGIFDKSNQSDIVNRKIYDNYSIPFSLQVDELQNYSADKDLYFEFFSKQDISVDRIFEADELSLKLQLLSKIEEYNKLRTGVRDFRIKDDAKKLNSSYYYDDNGFLVDGGNKLVKLSYDSFLKLNIPIPDDGSSYILHITSLFLLYEGSKDSSVNAFIVSTKNSSNERRVVSLDGL